MTVDAVIRCVAAALIASCANDPNRSADATYLHDATFRRAALEASLVNRANGYSRLRLTHYASGGADDWERLPEWNPAVEPLRTSDLEAPGRIALPLTAASAPLQLAEANTLDPSALIALGREAFARYPAQLATYLGAALAAPAAADRLGLWTNRARGVGGVVRTEMADGSVALALTCSTCHARADGDGIEDGAPNFALDLGSAMLAANGFDGASAEALRAWGPGRVDVSTSAGTEPARIPDLRPVRYLSHLQQDATVALLDRSALAIRIETLIITSHGQLARPPRIIAWALAAYIESLADALPALDDAIRASSRGAALFERDCRGCHAGDGLTGAPIALAVIGTDPTLGLSAERGTGAYRVPSLRGVGSRGPLLHDASVNTLAALFDPQRLSSGSPGTRAGAAVAGHEYGLELGELDRLELVRYLEAL